MMKRIALITLFGALLGCSHLLGFSEVKRQDGGISDVIDIVDVTDSSSVSTVCTFDDPLSTFDGACVFGN